MLTSQRKIRVIEFLERDGNVIAKNLAELWNVSEDTIRRDLRELAADGRLTRVHGGALPVSPAAQDFRARTDVATDSKQAVATYAASLVTDGQTIFIDGGTTAQALCRALPLALRATVITHAPTVALGLLAHLNVDVLLIGGRLFRHSVVATGAMAIEQIESMRADVFFMGVSGVHPTAGLTTGDAEEAAMKRAFCRRSSETYVLASAEKIGTASPFNVVDFKDITAAISDIDTRSRSGRALTKAGLRMICTGGTMTPSMSRSAGN
jgi:DeoR/GlpR family transcriptional regulator of sugar metabolism